LIVAANIYTPNQLAAPPCFTAYVKDNLRLNGTDSTLRTK